MWKNILNSVKSFLTAFFKSAWQKELAVLMPIALEVVESIDQSTLTNSEKRSTAFDTISAKVIDSQKSLAPFLINLAIELAVANLKAIAASGE